ncbi:MAG: peptide-methionine (S)-S-oxide reductase MsrA, partial [Chloroflexota bacterium]|nr:peptide-methionine (S)-S-oxide reductase MsrA [Chloroflexota bacterium]
MFPFRRPSTLPAPEDALPGRAEPIAITEPHDVNGASLTPPWPQGTRTAVFGLGCFWGAEKAFWELDGVVSTAVGYAGGNTPNPTYEETCGGQTGHAEVVLVVYDPERISYDALLKLFWEQHDPTQGMRQGNDQGTQYRSIIFTTTDEERATAEASRDAYQQQLTAAGFGTITTEITKAGEF